jgi:hypothetical protein
MSSKSIQHTLLHPLVSSSFGNLVRVVAAYRCEVRYLPRLFYLVLMTLLRQPVILWESAKYGRRIGRQQVEPPLFIIGHWRSGTTHLHNVMSRDPQFGRVSLLQAAMPHDFLTLSGIAQRRFGGMLPGKRLMDNVPVSAEAPWEEEMALTSTGRLSFYHVSFFPRCMGRIFVEAVLLEGANPSLQAKWMRQYLAFLRKIQFSQPGTPLLLKNPANTARIDLLREMFPGARFVHIHRNPYKVFASTVHLYLKAQEAWGLHRTDRDRVVRHVLETYPMLMNAFFAQRGSLGDGELTDVSFRDLQEDAMGTLAGIYRQLDLAGFEEAAPRFQAYLDSQRDYRKNRLPLSPEEREEVGRRWGEIFEQLGYSI